MLVCVGGGARDAEGGPRSGRGRGDRWGGGISPPVPKEGGKAFNRGGPRTPFEALWAELRAGKEGIEGSESAEEDSRLKEGPRGVGGESGVVGGDDLVVVWRGFLNGGGGGGIALRSRTCFVAASFSILRLGFESKSLFSLFASSEFCSGVSDSFIVRASWRGFFDEKIREGRRSHCRMSHEDGGHL
jgi:hypothetical protein